MPGYLNAYATRGEYVAMALGLRSVALWRVSRGVRAVDTSKLVADVEGHYKETMALMDPRLRIELFFHPAQEGTFYGSMLLVNMDVYESLMVLKFQDGRHSESFDIKFADITGLCVMCISADTLTLTNRPAGSYGDFVVAEVESFGPDNARRCQLCEAIGTEERVTVLIFNVYTSSFSVRHGQPLWNIFYGEVQGRPMRMSHWNDYETQGMPNLSVVTMPHVDHPAPSPREMRIWTATPELLEDDKLILRGRKMTMKEHFKKVRERWPDDYGDDDYDTDTASDSSMADNSQLLRRNYSKCQFILDHTGEPGPLPERREVPYSILYCEDDDFIVFVYSTGYTVWSFWTDMPAIVSDG
jgi:hypothetical protein